MNQIKGKTIRVNTHPSSRGARGSSNTVYEPSASRSQTPTTPSIASSYAQKAKKGPSIGLILFLVLLFGGGGAGGYFYYQKMEERKASAEAYRVKIEGIQTDVKLAIAYFKEHPQNFDVAMERAQEALDIAKGTSYATDAKALIETIKAARVDAVDLAWNTIRQDVEDMRNRDPDAALSLLNAYTGPFADEIRPKFTPLINAIKKDLLIRKKEQERLTALARQNTEKERSIIADALLTGHYAEVAQLTNQSDSDQTFHKSALQAAQLPEAVCKTFENQIGKTVRVGTRKGKMKLKITKVKGLKIAANKPIIVNGAESGSRPLVFQFTDLSTSEIAKRLSSIKTADGVTMLGLIYYQAKKYKEAQKLFARANTDLSNYLAEEAAFQQKALPDPVQQSSTQEVFEPDENNELIVL